MMRIRCNREILSALKDIEFPKTKNQILALAETKNDICEASVIMLNKLENRTYNSIDEVCENVKVICNLELRNALSGIKFPVKKDDIIKYLKEEKYPDSVVDVVEELPEELVYNSIADICR